MYIYMYTATQPGAPLCWILNANSGGQPKVPKAMLSYSEINAFLQRLVKSSQKTLQKSSLCE